MNYKPLISCTIIALVLVSILSPAVTASVVYGPARFNRTSGGPALAQDNFSLIRNDGNFSLFIKNGDGAENLTSSALVRLNGEMAVRANEFNQNIFLISKNISVAPANRLEVEIRSIPGGYITLWVEDESPVINILSPWDDAVSNGTITVSSNVTDLNITNLTMNHNGNISTVPVVSGNFSNAANLTGISNITLRAVDSVGKLRSATLLLDGDMLPESRELLLGFDPQEPDSDSTLTPENEAGNGIIDGYETLGNQLPAFVKSRIGADPFKNDTDNDGLTDYFELMKLGLITDVRSGDSDGDGMPDNEEDLDDDGLTNLQEQDYGTDPLVSDTDKDSLSDGIEVSFGTNPLLKDTDNDRLDDDSEIRLGTNPLNPDTDGDGILDGDEVYSSIKKDDALGVRASITGKGDVAKELNIYNVTSEIFTNISVLVSPVIDFSLNRTNRTFETAGITLPYNAQKVSNPSNLSLFYFNESLGTFVQIESTVDAANHTVTGISSHFSTFAIFDVPNWNALFKAEMNMGRGGADVMFIMDRTGSMSYYDPYEYRKIAAKNFVGALIPGDRAGVVDFHDVGARLIQPLTSDFNAVNSSIDRLDLLEEMISYINIGAGVGMANDHLINSGNSNHARMMILLTDSEGYYNNYYTQQAVENDITIYTIGLGWYYFFNPTDLPEIATATGGKYYSVTSADQLPEVYRKISEEIRPTDSDNDGLSDALETGGFRDGFGNRYFTEPNDHDTDGDGLSDGEEAGVLTEFKGKKYFKINSKPTLVDSDRDSIADSDEEEFGTMSLDPDYDKDKLNDGFELGIGTDPQVEDTDYDGHSDFEEHYDPFYDPLVYEKRYSNLEIARDVVLGAVQGEWSAENNDSVYYLSGWMLSGFIAVGDIRDIAASIARGDGLGTFLNALALIPGYGDAAKVSATITKFVANNPHMLSSVASFVVKYVDDSIGLVKASIGEDIVKNLNTKGFSDDVIVSLYKQGINLKAFDELLTNSNIYTEFPGLSTFVKEQLTGGNLILKDKVTFDVKKMTAAYEAGGSTAGYLGNLKGAYTEYLAKGDIAGNTIINIKHINKGGVDYAAFDGGVLKIVEAKARQSLTLANFKKNYLIINDNGVIKGFNAKYAIKDISENYFKDPSTQKQFILYLNGPNSQAIKNSLNLPASLPYEFKDSNYIIRKGTVDIVVMAVNK